MSSEEEESGAEELQLVDTSSSDDEADDDLSNGDDDESAAEVFGEGEIAEEAEAEDLISEEKETEEEKKKRSDFVNRVRERLEAQDKRYQREAQSLGEVDAQGNDLLDTEGKRIPAEERSRGSIPPVPPKPKKRKKVESSSEDPEDDPKPSNDDVHILVIKPPTKATRADIIVPLGPAPKYKFVAEDKSLKFSSDSEDEEEEQEEQDVPEQEKEPSLDEIQKNKMQLVKGGVDLCPDKVHISASSKRSGTMPPECWWCLFGDRDLERVDADAFHLFEQAYDRALPRMPKEQLAYYLYRLWQKLIFIPSIEEGRDIPNMTPELFLRHMMFHNPDPKMVQMEQLRTMRNLMNGLEEVFWVRQGVFDPGNGYREQTVPSLPNINTYLKVETRWETLSQKDVSAWMGADANSTASIRDQRRFDKWGSTKAETVDDRRKRAIENNHVRERAYKHRRLVLDGGKN